MPNFEDFNKDAIDNNPAGAVPPAMPEMNPPLMQGMNPPPLFQAGINAMRAFQMAYPEIFYKIQPYIMMACDQLEAYAPAMPDQKMIEQMADSIYDNLMRMHPDLAEYMRSNESPAKGGEAVQAISYGNFRDDRYDSDDRHDMDDRHDRDDFFFRRRGLPRDLIQILLLSELGRRRRRFFY